MAYQSFYDDVKKEAAKAEALIEDVPQCSAPDAPPLVPLYLAPGGEVRETILWRLGGAPIRSLQPISLC